MYFSKSYPMPTVEDLIVSHSRALPQPLQKEVLDFIDFLVAKHALTIDENNGFSAFSLANAVKDTEDEDFSDFSSVIFKQKWK